MTLVCVWKGFPLEVVLKTGKKWRVKFVHEKMTHFLHTWLRIWISNEPRGRGNQLNFAQFQELAKMNYSSIKFHYREGETYLSCCTGDGYDGIFGSGRSHPGRHGLVGFAENFGDPFLVPILAVWESSGAQRRWVGAVLWNTKITHLVRKCIST